MFPFFSIHYQPQRLKAGKIAWSVKHKREEGGGEGAAVQLNARTKAENGVEEW